MTFRADLHCHTIHSDGSKNVEALIDLAIANQLQGLSITDHDTIAAYAEAIPYAKKKGLLLGAGVEFSCVHQGLSVHVLGYGFPVDSQEILHLCERHQLRRKERNLAILKKLERMGMPIAEEELPILGSVGRPHIAQLLVAKGFVPTLQEAFQRYIGEGKPCFEQGTSFSVEETLEILHRSHAKAFIAHPHLYDKASLVRKLLDLPFDGLECYYAKCYPQEEARWCRLAKERGLLVSGGSDYHGAFKPHTRLGSSWVDREVFKQIFGF